MSIRNVTGIVSMSRKRKEILDSFSLGCLCCLLFQFSSLVKEESEGGFFHTPPSHPRVGFYAESKDLELCRLRYPEFCPIPHPHFYSFLVLGNIWNIIFNHVEKDNKFATRYQQVKQSWNGPACRFCHLRRKLQGSLIGWLTGKSEFIMRTARH